MVPSPSNVVISDPATVPTGVTQERIAWPFTMTVQAPHCARPQPNFGPRSSRSSLSTYSNGVVGSRSNVCARPSTFRVMVLISTVLWRELNVPKRRRTPPDSLQPLLGAGLVALGQHLYLVDRVSAQHVQGFLVGPGKREVLRLPRGRNGPEMLPLRAKYLDACVRGHVQPAGAVDGAAVSSAVCTGVGLAHACGDRREGPLIPGSAVGLNVEGFECVSVGIEHVKRPLVRAEDEAVGTRDVVGDLDDPARRLDVVDGGLNHVLRNPEIVGKVHATLLVDREIVGTSEAMGLELVGERNFGRSKYGHPCRHPLHADRAALRVERETVGRAGTFHVARDIPVLVDLRDAVGHSLGEKQAAIRCLSRALGAHESFLDELHFRAALDDTGNVWSQCEKWGWWLILPAAATASLAQDERGSEQTQRNHNQRLRLHRLSSCLEFKVVLHSFAGLARTSPAKKPNTPSQSNL